MRTHTKRHRKDLSKSENHSNCFSMDNYDTHQNSLSQLRALALIRSILWSALALQVWTWQGADRKDETADHAGTDTKSVPSYARPLILGAGPRCQDLQRLSYIMFPAVLWAMDNMWQLKNMLLMMAGIKKFRMAFKKYKNNTYSVRFSVWEQG